MDGEANPPPTIEAYAPVESVRRLYDAIRGIYGAVVAPFERRPRQRSLELAAIRGDDDVLEVAVGPAPPPARFPPIRRNC